MLTSPLNDTRQNDYISATRGLLGQCEKMRITFNLVTNNLVQASTNTRWRHREQIFGAQLRKFTFKHRGVFWTPCVI